MAVFIRDAKVADLGRLPLPDAHTSLVPYLRENATTDFQDNLHPHPLIFHKADDGIRASRVCNACVQSVSPPFFSCSHCPDFFLHSCCAHLPSKSDTGLTNSIPFYSLQKHPIPTFLQASPARAVSFGAMGSPTLARPATTSAWMLFAP